MLSSITILATLAYAISKKAGSDGSADVLAQLFGGATGNAFHGDVEKLRSAFLNITRPDSNQDLERAVARSSLHASLFCLMEALGEPLEPPTGKLAVWRECIEARLPQALRDIRRPVGGFLSETDRRQLLQAKEGCETDRKQIEVSFTPVPIPPGKMPIAVDDRYAEERAAEALAEIEKKSGPLPNRTREIFLENWFGFLCGSFHYEIKRRQPIANILLNLSIAELGERIDRRFDETNQRIREFMRPGLTSLDPFAAVPPLPRNFINRPELSEPLRDALISDSNTVALTAIEGMGGVWKTIVALGLCHDPQVRSAFSDGIVWLDIGREAKVPIEKCIERVARALN